MSLISFIEVLQQTKYFYIRIIWVMSQVFLCLIFDEIRLSISYEFYMKDIYKDLQNVVKSFNSVLLFICLYATKDTEGLVQDLQEVKYAGPGPKAFPNFQDEGRDSIGLNCYIW